MLIVCNGAIKSGSTWLYNLLIHFAQPTRPPDEYLTANSLAPGSNPCIRPDRLAAFLAAGDWRERDVITKNHLGEPWQRDLLLAHEGVRVFGIERDLRDVVVSAYYDVRNRHGASGDFRSYYWREGRYTADRVVRYHAVWREAGDSVCTVAYERLHSDFAGEARRIATALGLDPNPEMLEAARAATTIGRLRARYHDQELYRGERFFRKGVVGDWQNHFDGAIARDLARIEANGIGAFDWRALLRRSTRPLYERLKRERA